MKDSLGQKVDRLKAAIARLPWVPAFVILLAVSLMSLGLWWQDRHGRLAEWTALPELGHVVRAFGTVKRNSWASSTGTGSYFAPLDDGWSRLDSSHSLLVPIRTGDVVQTGEHSAAELLFYGGNKINLESGSVARFEDLGNEISVRLVMGRAYIELPTDHQAGRPYAFLKPDGSVLEVPEGQRLILAMGSAEAIDESEGSEDVQVVETEEAADAFSNIELRLMAQGEEVLERHPLIVEPIEERDRVPAAVIRREENRADIAPPKPVFPHEEADIDLEEQEGLKFRWSPLEAGSADPVVAYEIVIRPAPGGYEVEDSARKVQIFKQRNTEFPMEKVDGSGVFLWSVRAVTASGGRGPASTPRWLEIRFPKRLPPPKMRKPMVK